MFSPPGRRRDPAMVNALINRQSTMMAYNHCFLLVVPMFLIVLPLLFLLPKEGVPSGTVEQAEAH